MKELRPWLPKNQQLSNMDQEKIHTLLYTLLDAYSLTTQDFDQLQTKLEFVEELESEVERFEKELEDKEEEIRDLEDDLDKESYVTNVVKTKLKIFAQRNLGVDDIDYIKKCAEALQKSDVEDLEDDDRFSL